MALPRFDQSGLDLRTIGTVDMGADEVGVFWNLVGTPSGGSSVHFTAAAPANQNGHVSEIFVSLGSGERAEGS